MLKLPDQWLWDFWPAQDGPDYHLFYLQAPRSLMHEQLRHWHVSIGHAVSHNLRDWQVLPDALKPSTPDAWDDYTTWTGSVVRHDGLWYMFYTGGRRSERGLVQRIGLATSEDLVHWHKHPANPLITPDPRWYELLNLNSWHDQAWRDPWLVRHPRTGQFHALITARVNYGPADGRGVIGHARSSDLVHWEVLPPLTEPGDFGQLEVPQIVTIGTRSYLLFSTRASDHSGRWRQRTGLTPLTGTHYLVADDLLGPFHALTDRFLLGDTVGSLYSGKLIQGPDQAWYLLAARLFTAEGAFLGELSDPFPITTDDEGRLHVEEG